MTRLPHRTFLHKPCYFSGRSALAPDALSLLSFFFSFWSTRVSQLIFCLLKPAPNFFSLNFHQFSGVFHGRDYISHPPKPPLLLTPVLSCSPNSHRNFCISYTHLHADKSSPLSSPSFVLHVCMVKQISPLFHFHFCFFSLLSLFSFAPEIFPFDPVQNPWLYVLVQKATK